MPEILINTDAPIHERLSDLRMLLQPSELAELANLATHALSTLMQGRSELRYKINGACRVTEEIVREVSNA